MKITGDLNEIGRLANSELNHALVYSACLGCSQPLSTRDKERGFIVIYLFLGLMLSTIQSHPLMWNVEYSDLVGKNCEVFKKIIRREGELNVLLSNFKYTRMLLMRLINIMKTVYMYLKQ